MRRDHFMKLQKKVQNGVPYKSVVLKFSRKFLRDFYHAMDKNIIPTDSKREMKSLTLLPYNRPDIKSLFESVIPFFDSDVEPTEALLQLKMTEGLYILLQSDNHLYASLFDFTEPWKIDILEYMNTHYMYDLTLAEMASDTGRSLATFKRDFKRVSNLSPYKWLIRKRVEAAHELLSKGDKKVTDVCFDVGFKNLSHFSKVYKEVYGVPPTHRSR